MAKQKRDEIYKHQADVAFGAVSEEQVQKGLSDSGLPELSAAEEEALAGISVQHKEILLRRLKGKPLMPLIHQMLTAYASGYFKL